MAVSFNTWAVVLAAGDGTRLNSLTTRGTNAPVPKQFCSLRGGDSLLTESLRRASGITAASRTCAIVAAQHSHWWEPMLRGLPPANVIMQPRNCGTGIGILYALLHVMRVDPDARVMFLPSDHYVLNEAALTATMLDAVDVLTEHEQSVLLLGIEPEEADPDLGYIVPGRMNSLGLLHVDRFVEKPDSIAAKKLLEQGALWNAFIVAARARSFLRLFESRHVELVRTMSSAMSSTNALLDLYQRLPKLDFSSQVLQGSESYLRLLKVNCCGWNDLGTPRRVAETLRRMPSVDELQPSPIGTTRAVLDLAAQHKRLGELIL